MNAIDESDPIRSAVAATFWDAGLAWPSDSPGPVPLGNLISSYPIVHQEVDGLNRAAASAVLRGWDVRWSAIPREDPPLAGFIYAGARAGRRASFIFVRRGDILPRRRFTAAHELGHYRLHFGPEAAEMVEVDGDEQVEESCRADLATMERQANRFAAELLMPEAVCRALHGRHARQYGPVDRYLVYRIASELLVSRSAIAWRLFGLGLIDRPTWLPKVAIGPINTPTGEAD